MLLSPCAYFVLLFSFFTAIVSLDHHPNCQLHGWLFHRQPIQGASPSNPAGARDVFTSKSLSSSCCSSPRRIRALCVCVCMCVHSWINRPLFKPFESLKHSSFSFCRGNYTLIVVDSQGVGLYYEGKATMVHCAFVLLWMQALLNQDCTALRVCRCV